jgi:hypothetical protein
LPDELHIIAAGEFSHPFDGQVVGNPRPVLSCIKSHYDNLLAQTLQYVKFPVVPCYKGVLRCMRENGWSKKNGSSHPTGDKSRRNSEENDKELEAARLPMSMRCGISIFTMHKSNCLMHRALGSSR